MGKVSMSCYRAISALPISPYLKFSIVRAIRSNVFRFRDRLNGGQRRASLIMSNEGYGHEHWLRTYSGYNRCLFAQIEHGVYFGCNTSSKVNPISQEYQIGSFITFGRYREKCLARAFPEAHIEMIGPYIRYAKTDDSYKFELQSKLDQSGKTLTVFPAHSVRGGKTQFSHAELIVSCKRMANECGCCNLVACLSPMDYSSQLADLYESNGFIVATSGSNSIEFLPRQRAIFELSDMTVSNDLGTHVGYSLAMGVPHRFVDVIPFSEKIIAPGADVEKLKSERSQIISAFTANDDFFEITQEQIYLLDYFWGLGIQLSPNELYAALHNCEVAYKSRRVNK